MTTSIASFFAGLSEQECGALRSRLTRHRVCRGSTVIEAGQALNGLMIIETGFADVYVPADVGVRRIGRVGPGETLGEVSLFSGGTASATVVATTEMELLLIDADALPAIAASFPRIYHNLGAILAGRLARADSRLQSNRRGEVIALDDGGAPPLLGYALACSIAWHSQRSVALIAALSGAPPPELVPFAWAAGGAGMARLDPIPGRAQLVLSTATDQFVPATLCGTIEDLCNRYDYVLVQSGGGMASGEEQNCACRPRARLRLLPAAALPAVPASGAAPEALAGWFPPGSGAAAGGHAVTHVPQPGSRDLLALCQGQLPPSTACGRALGAVARRFAHCTVGLALGSGSAKGYAHLGVLRVLEHAGVPIDYIAGASIGAAVAAMYAAGEEIEAISAALDRASRSLFRLTVSTRSLISSAGVRQQVQRLAGERRIEELALPLAIVAADLATRREIVFRQGLLWPALLASMSIPGIYPPVRMGAQVLVDGGVLDPVPAGVVADMGADIVIAVGLAASAERAGRVSEAASESGPLPSAMQALLRSVDLMQSRVETPPATTIRIEPQFPPGSGLHLRDFARGRAYVPRGEAAAELALPRIAAALPWLKAHGGGIPALPRAS